MDSKLQVFKQNFCFTKEDVKKEFSNFVSLNFINDDEEQYSNNYLQSILQLCKKFEDTLESANLPKITDDWWYYDFDLKNDAIELNLYFCKELELDEDGEISGYTSTLEFTLLNVKCDYLNVNQFAEMYDVTETTVRQWIRRGKLRTAKKVGRDWIIPSIAERPSRGFKNVSYRWSFLPEKIKNQFPFLENYNVIYIFQDEKDKSLFNCILGYPGQDNRTEIVLNTPEREKLELALIGNDFVEVDEW